MGWFDEDRDPEGRHEGWVASVVQDDWRFRELTAADHEERDIEFVQVACSCGWRTRRMLAPVGTKWYPCSTELPPFGNDSEHWEDVCKTFWDEHMAGDLVATVFGRSLDLAFPKVASR